MVKVSKEFTFDSSHRLDNPNKSYEWNVTKFGKCNHSPSHGHTYRLIVTVKNEPNADTGMVINFVDLKEIVTRRILEKLDHKFLNDELGGMITTCENMVKWIWGNLIVELPNLYEITLYETPTSYATYNGE